MVSLEQSQGNVQMTENVMNKEQVDLIVTLLNKQKGHLEDKEDLENQMEKIINLLESDENIPRIYGKMNLEIALVKHDMMKVILGLFKDEFIRIKSELKDDDNEGLEAVTKLIELFSDKKTVEAFSISAKAEVSQYLESWNASDYDCQVDMSGHVQSLNISLGRSLTVSAGRWTTGSTSPAPSSPTPGTGSGLLSPRPGSS